MVWLVKILLLTAKTRRGRELLFAAALGAYQVARSERAQKLYANAWSAARDPRPREYAIETLEKLRGSLKR
jgi:hypothetical protein